MALARVRQFERNGEGGWGRRVLGVTILDVLGRWPSVEADFQQFYGIADPLLLPWRKFRVLLSQLPGESRLRASLREEPGAGVNSNEHVARLFDQAKGRTVNRRVMSMSEFIGAN